jgi:hypothetical protein
MTFRINIGIIILSVCATLFLCGQALPQENEEGLPEPAPQKLTMVKASLCESIEGSTPRNEAIVFSVAIGKVSCLTSFDPVPEQTIIFHNWFYRDELTTRRQLTLQTPRWATFSSIQLRDADKGPWRVEVTDENGNNMQTLRFSITD